MGDKEGDSYKASTRLCSKIPEGLSRIVLNGSISRHKDSAVQVVPRIPDPLAFLASALFSSQSKSQLESSSPTNPLSKAGLFRRKTQQKTKKGSKEKAHP